jgi:hypothetical protein
MTIAIKLLKGNTIVMITSFFAPKSKAVPGDERTRKRVAEDARRRGAGDDDDDGRMTKKVATTTPPSESSSQPASASSDGPTLTTTTAEAIALLSLLMPCEEGGGRRAASVVAARVVPDWRGVLEAHFATSSFSSLAKFVARERCVLFRWCHSPFSLGRGQRAPCI